jgi:hypothetical protein
MDDVNKTPDPIVSEISEVARHGLILWRLAMKEDRDLWCFVFDTSIGFFLVVEDHPEGTAPPRLSERHSDVIALVNRTDALKGAFLQDGWAEVDVD